MKISIIIPVYNEVNTILTVLLTFYDIYIARLIYKLICSLRILDDDEISKLKKIKELKTTLLYW